MAAQGTPQNYLYDKRPSIDSHRDRSMEQYYTPSGNPYGYNPGGSGPQYSGYTPPQVATGKWAAQAFAPRSNQFTLPGATNGVTPGYVPPPGASQYMPNFQSFQDAYNNAQQQGGGNQAALAPGAGMNPQAPSPQSQQAMQEFIARMTQQPTNYQPQVGGLTAGPSGFGSAGAPSNVTQMTQQFLAAQQAQQAAMQAQNPNQQRGAAFAPQFNPQPAINPNDPTNNAALLLGAGGGNGYGRSYAPMLQR